MKKPVTLVVVAICVFGGLVVLCVHELLKATPAAQAVVIPIVATGIGGGLLKLINILQNWMTDKKIDENGLKVDQDVANTKAVARKVEGVHQLVNGGLEERITRAVAAAMAAREAAAAKPTGDPPVGGSVRT